MRRTESIAGAVATVIAVGALISGSAVVTPDTYHDMKNPAITQTLITDDPSSSVVAVLDTYHDM
jgi:hypothetical protein